MSDEDLFLNLILKNNIEDICNVISRLKSKKSGLSYENNFALRFCLYNDRINIAKIILQDDRIYQMTNDEWLKNNIRDKYIIEEIIKIKININIDNF